MKAMGAVIALLGLGLGATAQAKIVPLESQAAVTAFEFSAASQLAAAREAEYFRAPQTPLASERIIPRCRLQHIVFDKTLLAQSCQ